MGEKEILARMAGGRRADAQSLDEYFETEGERAWGRLREAARQAPGAFDAGAIQWIVDHVDGCPRAAFAALLDVAARDGDRAGELVKRYRELLPAWPGDALAAAGYNLHEYCRLLDADWMRLAREHFDSNPEGAWGVATAAAAFHPALLPEETLAWFEERAGTAPREYFRVLLSVASSDAGRTDALVARALAAFDRWPVEAVEAAAGAAGEKHVLRPGLMEAVLRHVGKCPEKGWEFFDRAAYAAPELFDEGLLDGLEREVSSGARTFFGVLHHLADPPQGPPPGTDRERSLMSRFARALPRHPAEALDAAHYVAVNDSRLLDRTLVDLVAAHAPANAYPAFDVLHAALRHRPELIGRTHLEAALEAVPLATNWAFGFFRRALELRPEFTPLCTAALFDCLSLEPANRAPTRVEELGSIVTIAQASHVRTELERALRQPPGVGSRRARALMAILFRQASRARQHVLFEALRFAATACTWSDRNWTPLWDFFMLLLDHSGEDAVSTATAERFLEGAFQLSYLMERGVDHDAFREKFDLRELPAAPWPPGLEFLEREEGLGELHRGVAALAARLGATVRLRPLEEFLVRAGAAETELEALGREVAGADPKRRGRIGERIESLRERIRWWRDPAYAAALGRPEAEEALPAAARMLARRERRDLAKRVRDALRAELMRVAVDAVESSRLDLYRSKVRGVLGRDVDLSRVEPSILPSFLFFSALGAYPNNRQYLARLIEDRIEGRPHDWLWTEPPVLKWKEKVREHQPGARFERWRAAFAREYRYLPGDAAAERKRRIREDLAQARQLLEQLGVEGLKDSSYAELSRALEGLRAGPPADEKAPRPDPRVLDEVGMNLERVKIVEQTPESDFEGTLRLEVETDPFEVLFMGEYGFASCLSLRGSNVWSAVSNAVDVDKAIVWAKEPGGNVVGRRLLALTPEGVLSYRTYANRHGLALDGMFDDFIRAYAAHCGTGVTHGGAPGPLLSDRWYDDGAL